MFRVFLLALLHGNGINFFRWVACVVGRGVMKYIYFKYRSIFFKLHQAIKTEIKQYGKIITPGLYAKKEYYRGVLLNIERKYMRSVGVSGLEWIF